MEVHIVTLSENTAQAVDLLGEWGLSVLIEVDNLRILFDTGQSISTVHNADVLGQNLSTVNTIVLSHGHFDHTGGLREVLRRMRKNVEVIAHPDIWDAKYGGSASVNIYRYIGIPFEREELETRGASFSLNREPLWLTDNIVTTGEIPMITEYEQIDAGLYIKRGEEFVPDPILDDQAIIVKTSEGLVVIAGCAHRGIVNTIRHAQGLTGEERICAVVGGIHLIRASEEQRELTIAAFREMGVRRIGVSHCTGMPAAARMAQEFGDSFFFNNVGTVVDFP